MLIVIWIFMAICSGIAASNKNRSVVGWFILGLLFGIFALIPILILKPLDE